MTPDLPPLIAEVRACAADLGRRFGLPVVEASDRRIAALLEGRAPSPHGHDQVDALLATARAQASERIADLARRALERQLPGEGAARLLNDAEREELIEVLASIRATAELAGRAAVREQQRHAIKAQGGKLAEALLCESLGWLSEAAGEYSVPLLAPEKAVDYFKSLFRDPANKGEVAIFRGVTEPGWAARALAGDVQPAPGDYGSGHYFATDPYIPTSYAAGPQGDSPGVVLSAAIKPGAKVMPIEELERLLQAAVQRGEVEPTMDYGDFARRIGVDVISVPHKGYMNVINLDAIRYTETPGFLDKMDPLRYGRDLRRQAFTLAGEVDNQLLGAVHAVIAERVKTGETVSSAPRVIGEILDAAGLTTANPQRPEMIFRTNAMDAYNQGATEELQDPEVIETFPVWEYSNPSDSRSRPEHAARDGLYWPSTVAFVRVRGTDIADAANCRCTFIPISKWEWVKLQVRGAKLQPVPTLAA